MKLLSARSLGAKLTFSLLLTSLISLAFVGFWTNRIMFQRFNELVLKEAFAEYRADVGAYFDTYGSWEEGQKVEPLQLFNLRRREQMDGQSGGSVSPSMPPLYRFLLLDAQGRVLQGGPTDKVGELAPQDLRKKAQPILHDGQIVALAVPIGEPALTPYDHEYLATMRLALLKGMILATLLALSLGLWFGSRLNARMRELTCAFDEMGRGKLLQQVPVESDDEIGMMALAFNQMSRDLAASHEALRASHEKIEVQAFQLREASIRDALTTLYNRRYFDEQIAPIYSGAQRYDQPFTVMIGDIDFFKRINDQFSHAIGDQVLRHVAQILLHSIRESDIVARYGGEEFVLALPQTNINQAAELCERLRARIESHEWEKLAPGLRVTMSMGLCDDKRVGGPEKMLAVADLQLYQAKENGRNQVRFLCEASSSMPSHAGMERVL